MARRKLPQGPAPARARIIGAYELPHTEDLRLIEAVFPIEPAFLDLRMFNGYTPNAWGPYGLPIPEFYLSDDGERLIASYLGGLDDFYAQGFRQRKPSTRIAFFVNDYMADPWLSDDVATPWGRLRVPGVTPCPQRLLRLIWSEY